MWIRIRAVAGFLLHLAPGGKSHCVALSVSTRGEARLRDGVREWNLTTCEIMDLIDKAVDRKYMVFFSVQFSRGRNSQAVCAHERGNFAALLDMQAGANSAKPQVYDGDDSNDFAWDAADDAGQRVDEDDKDDTVISESDEEAATAVADELLENSKWKYLDLWIRRKSFALMQMVCGHVHSVHFEPGPSTRE